MPFDAIMFYAVKHELILTAMGAKIDKIHQPERDEILISLRLKTKNTKLLISTAPNGARICFSNEKRENPGIPPMFCMLLRKHLTGGRIVGITQPGLERVLSIEIETINEMGELGKKYLNFEVIGKHSNIILTDAENRIIDCIKRVDSDMGDKRRLLSGLFYRLPEAAAKQDLFETDKQKICGMIRACDSDIALDKWVTNNFLGLSPLVSREISFAAAGSASKQLKSLTESEMDRVADALLKLRQRIENYDFEPCLIYRHNEELPFEFSFMKIEQYGNAAKTIRPGSFSELLSEYYDLRGMTERRKKRAQNILKLATTAYERLLRKVAYQTEELKASKDREQLKKYGDLLTANLYSLEKGISKAEVCDYYEEGAPKVSIPMDIRLTPQQNAQKYYKDYARAKKAAVALSALIEEGKHEVLYLESVIEEIGRAENDKDIEEIYEELTLSGYINKKREMSKNKGKKGAKKDIDLKTKPYQYITEDGFYIYAGRNNRQNDMLTFKTAYKNDVWFHTRNIPGAHVILVCDKNEPTDKVYTQAAMIAALHSKAASSEKVPVDYTRVKNVKKPPGAKPGMVIYSSFKTAYVTPNKEKMETMKEKQK